MVYPALLKYIGAAGEGLHSRLANEVRAVIKEEGGAITLIRDRENELDEIRGVGGAADGAK